MKKYKLTLIAAAIALSCGSLQANATELKELTDSADDPVNVEASDDYNRLVTSHNNGSSCITMGK